MNVSERFDEEEKILTDDLAHIQNTGTDRDEKIKQLLINQEIMIKNINNLLNSQNILKNERDEIFEQLEQFTYFYNEIKQLKNKKDSKNIKYVLVGLLSLATVSSAVLLPDAVKLLSIGFVCPLVNQLYYLFRDK